MVLVPVVSCEVLVVGVRKEVLEHNRYGVQHKFDGNKMELEDSVGAMEDIN